MDALFLYFSKSEAGERANDNINDVLSKIIASRKKKPNTDSTKSNLKIDRIPNQLIGAIASYMQQKDYINFSKSNRSVYLGCNTPNLMQELDLLNVSDYSSINLSSYRFVKVFRFQLYLFNAFEFNQKNVLPYLETVEIYGEHDTVFGINGFVNKVKKHFNVTNISCLRLDGFGWYDTARFDVDHLYKIISLFPNVAELVMNCVYLNNPVNLDKMFPKLNRLSLFFGPSSSVVPLIEHYQNSLSLLSLTEIAGNLDFSGLDLSALEILHLSPMTKKSIEDILKTAVNLEQICLLFDDTSTSTIKYGVQQSIKSDKALNAIDLILDFDDDKNELLSTLEGLEEGLFETTNLNRKEMRIMIRPLYSFEIERFTVRIGNIINWLQMSTEHFLLMFELHKGTEANVTTSNETKQIIQGIFAGIKVDYYDDLKLLVIKNEKCRIEGFHSIQ